MSANELTVEALLRAHAPRAPESLRARVLANEPVRRAAPRRALLVVAAATCVAVGAAVIHGVAGSGTSPKRVTLAGGTAHGSAAVGGGLKSYSASVDSKARIAAPSSRLQHTDA